jgi:hypothetical protein
VVRQEVGGLALPLITPLGANEDRGRHGRILPASGDGPPMHPSKWTVSSGPGPRPARTETRAARRRSRSGRTEP